MRLKAKFQHLTVSGVKIGFKLPDGTQTHYVFPHCSSVKVICSIIMFTFKASAHTFQDLYQYLVSKDVVPPFSLIHVAY